MVKNWRQDLKNYFRKLSQVSQIVWTSVCFENMNLLLQVGGLMR